MSTLLCFDGSDSAQRAVDVCSRTLGDEDTTLLHVWTPPVAYLADSFSDADKAEVPLDRLESLARERAEVVAGQGAQLASERGLTVTTRVERSENPVWQTILNVARESHAELIILGTHGHAAAQTALLGSVANAVAHHSSLPVLIVPDAGE